MPKKKFKDTKVGGFLSRSGSVIIDALGDSIPDKGLLGLVKNLVTDDKEMSEQQKAMAMHLIKMDEQEADAITKRWEADAKSDNKITKIARPVIVLYLTFIMSVYIVLDSVNVFSVDDQWVKLIETLLVTVYVAYFGSRGVEKYAQIKGK